MKNYWRDLQSEYGKNYQNNFWRLQLTSHWTRSGKIAGAFLSACQFVRYPICVKPFGIR